LLPYGKLQFALAIDFAVLIWYNSIRAFFATDI